MKSINTTCTTTIATYEGNNTDLREKPCCCCRPRCDCRSCALVKAVVVVGESSSSSMVQCSHCKLVWYCCRDCQKRDYLQHKNICRAIGRLQSNVEREARCLEVYLEWGTAEPENLFETAVGRFWDILDTREYIRVRLQLCQKQEELAQQVQTRDAWTVVLNHHLECLRLCASDNNGLRFAVPFLLLRLNRDDDAYCFCLHWLKKDVANDYEIESDHSGTKFGDWIYPRQESCRFLDLLQEISPNTLSPHFDIAFVLAVAVIKMRLVALYDRRAKEFESFTSTSSSKLLGLDELSEVRRSIMGIAEEEKQFADQRRQLNALLDLLQQRNASLAQALLHPDPLLMQASPYYSNGSPTEAYMSAKLAMDMWRQIPGANALLQHRLETLTTVPS